MAARKKPTKKSTKSVSAKAKRKSTDRARAKRTPGRGWSSNARVRSGNAKASSRVRALRKVASVKKRSQSSTGSKRKRTRFQSGASAKVKNTTGRRPKGAGRTAAPPKKSNKVEKTVGAKAEKLAVVKKRAKQVEEKLQSKQSPNVQGPSASAQNASAPTPPVKVASVAIGTVAPLSTGSASMKPAASATTKPVVGDEASGTAKPAKAVGQRQGFKLNEFVVYPAHGVGQIIAIEEQEVAGFRLELFVIDFSKDKLTLRVPTSRIAGAGMRKISDPDTAKRSLDILTGRARVKRTMWSRRAQEYEAKINSGDIYAIAEVVRDLYRSDQQPDQSYSERQLYEAALDRIVREIAAVHKSNETDALKVVEAQLQKGRASKPVGLPNLANEIEQAA